VATETLVCDAVGSTDNWSLAAGSTKVAAVATDDGDTSRIESGTTSGTIQQFTLANPANIASGDTINSVTLYAVCKRGGTPPGNYTVSAVLGANTTDGTSRTSGASYAETSETFSARPGGGAWTLTDVNNLVLQIRNTQTRNILATQLYAVVDYTVAAVAVNLEGTASLSGTLTASGTLAKTIGLSGSAALSGTLSASGAIDADTTVYRTWDDPGRIWDGDGIQWDQAEAPPEYLKWDTAGLEWDAAGLEWDHEATSSGMLLSGSASLAGTLTGQGALQYGWGLSGSAELVGTLTSDGGLEILAPVILSGTAALVGTVTGAGAISFPLALSGSAVLVGSVAGAGTLYHGFGLAGSAALAGELTGAGSITFPLELAGSGVLTGTLIGSGALLGALKWDGAGRKWDEAGAVWDLEAPPDIGLSGAAVLSGALIGSGALLVGSAVELSGTAALAGTLLGQGALIGDLRWDGQGRTWDEAGAVWDENVFLLSGSAALSGGLTGAGALLGELKWDGQGRTWDEVGAKWDGGDLPETPELPLFVGSNRVTSVYWGGRTLTAIWYQGQQVWP
jgi:hypothetical protein